MDLLGKTHTPAFFDVSFLGMELKCFEHTSPSKIVGLPEESHVYFLAVKKRRSKYFKLAYIGLTKNMQARFLTHNRLNRLRANQKAGKYRIYVMFKSFGSYAQNSSSEWRLIAKYTPPMSGQLEWKKSITERNFWDYLGVGKVRRSKYDFYNYSGKKLNY